MKKHNIVLAVLVCATAVSLSACSKAKVPTVDELFAQPFGSAAVTSGDLDVKLTTSVTTQSGTTDVDLNVNSRFQDTVRYISGTEAGTTGGTAYNNKLESYLVADGGGVYQHYSLNSQTGRWEVSSSDGSDAIDTSSLLDLNKSVFSDLAVQDYKKGDSEYVVRGTISYADLKTLLGGMSSKIPSTTDLGVLPATLRFDTTSKQLNSFMVLIEAPVGDINKFEFSYKVNNLNSTTVTLPDDVKNNAVPAGTGSSQQPISEKPIDETLEGMVYIEKESELYKGLESVGYEMPMSNDGKGAYVPLEMLGDYNAGGKDNPESFFKDVDKYVPQKYESYDDEDESSSISETDPPTPESEGLSQIDETDEQTSESESSGDENSDATTESTENESQSEDTGLNPITPSSGTPIGDGRVTYDAENWDTTSALDQMVGIYDILSWDTEDGSAILGYLEYMLTGNYNGSSGSSVLDYCKMMSSITDDKDRSYRYLAVAVMVDLGVETRDACVSAGASASELDSALTKLK